MLFFLILKAGSFTIKGFKMTGALKRGKLASVVEDVKRGKGDFPWTSNLTGPPVRSGESQ